MRYVATETVPIDKLEAYPGNARVHDDAALDESARTNGQYRSVVARRLGDGSLQLLAGHGTVGAFRRQGAGEVRVEVIEADDTEARRIVLADNASYRNAGYDDQLLLDLLDAASKDGGLGGTGWDGEAYKELLDAADEGNPFDHDPGGDGEAEEPPEEPVTRLGDVWILGKHRLGCGDSSDLAVLDSVIRGEKIGCLLTDPPYGMNLDTDYSKAPTGSANSKMAKVPAMKAFRPVIGDDESFDASFLRGYFARVKEQFWFGADYYRRTLSDDDLDGSWLIWDKRTEETDDVIGSGFETCWSAQKHQRRLLRHYWCGAFGNAEARNRVHPTQKPTALLVDILERWAPDGLPVADAFGGSGSTLIAAHTTGRPARLVELDPAYCDVIARRYQDLTGDLPVLERTGERFDFHGADGPVAVAA